MKTKPLHIVHVVRQYYPSYGGLEDFVRNLVLAQKSDGNTVSVVTLDTNFQNDEKLEASAVVDGVDVRRVGYIGSKRYSIAPAVRNHVLHADVVHIHAIDFFVDYLSLLKRLGAIKAKLIVSTHGGIFHTRSFYLLKQIFFRVITPFSLSGVAAVVASSYSDKDIFAPVARAVVVIENGVRLRKFGVASACDDGNGLLCLGRFSEHKNLLNLIRWFAAARGRDSSLRLCIAGRADTGDVDAMMREIERCGCADVVEVAADPTDAQICALIERCRFVVSASTYEGFGLTVPELMSYGLVPVLSAIPSFCRFVEQSAIGEIFALNEAAFVDAVMRAIANYSAAQTLLAEQFARRYSWDAVARSFEAVYHV